MKVAVIGLDSADWTLLDRWLHHLPNIAAIRRDGVSGYLESCRPPVTIPAWKCYSTGKNPGRLGIFWFAYPEFEKRRLTPNFPGGIGGNLWDYIPNALVVNTPGTFPPRTIDGVMIAGFPCPDDQPVATPAWALQQLKGYRVNSRTDPRDPTFPDEAMELIASRFQIFHRYAARFDFGQVTIFYIDELHHLYGSDSVVLDAWRLIDEEIGRIMTMADNVVLVSDHGSGPLSHFVNVVPALREMGAFRLRGRPGRKFAEVFRRAVQALPPSYRRKGGRLLSPKMMDAARIRLEHMHEWLPGAAEQFRIRVDWSSSVIPLNQGLLYLNPRPLSGSPPVSELLGAMEEMPGVVRVWRKEELYAGPRMSSAPEFWIEAEPGVEVVARFDDEWETKRPERGQEWIVNHRQDGVFAFLGSDVEPVEIERASIYDMCPTLLSFFDIPTPPSVDGTTLPVVRGESSREE